MSSQPTADPGSSAQVSSALRAAPHTSTGVWCSDLSWQDVFWAEPEMITPVGYMTCNCFQLEDLTGVESPYISLNYEIQCGSGNDCTTGACQ
jgi:hypothetical protein